MLPLIIDDFRQFLQRTPNSEVKVDKPSTPISNPNPDIFHDSLIEEINERQKKLNIVEEKLNLCIDLTNRKFYAGERILCSVTMLAAACGIVKDLIFPTSMIA